jgi:succinyl-CoA synthetase beta subunit
MIYMINGSLPWSGANFNLENLSAANRAKSTAFILHMKHLLTQNILKEPSLPIEYEYYLSYNFRYMKHKVLLMNHTDPSINKMV